MDLWIKRNGLRCSGSIVDGTFYYDESANYPDDSGGEGNDDGNKDADEGSDADSDSDVE